MAFRMRSGRRSPFAEQRMETHGRSQRLVAATNDATSQALSLHSRVAPHGRPGWGIKNLKMDIMSAPGSTGFFQRNPTS